mgnify:CR=1 FL=1
MKLSIYFVVCFLLISSSSALIFVNDIEKKVYNLGDKINISGYLSYDKDESGILELSLDCTKKNNLLVKVINVKKGEKYNFNEEVPLILNNPSKCRILSHFLVNSSLVDSAYTDDFILTDELEGIFFIDKTVVQQGNDIDIKGYVNKKNNESIEGIIILSFFLNNELYLIKNLNINDQFDLKLDTLDFIPGKYNLDILAKDSYGNNKNFQKALNFDIVNEVSVSVDINKKEVLPGVNIIIYGKANTILKESFKDGKVIIQFDDSEYETKLMPNGWFSYELFIPRKIKSGTHKVKISITDNFGNKGEKELLINVLPVPTNITFLGLNKKFHPNEDIVLGSFLYDQAGDLINELINVKIIDLENETLLYRSVKSGSEINFKIPERQNNNLKVIGEAGIIKEEIILIEEASSLYFEIINQTLIVENKGNTKYSEPIKMNISSSDVESVLIKKTSLNPGEKLKINLGRETKTGTYNIKVDGKVFKKVYIVGLGDKPYNLAYWVFIVILLVICWYVLFFREKMKLLKALREKRNLLRKKLGLSDNIDKVKKDIYKNNILRKFEEQERKTTKGLKFNFKKDNNDTGFYDLTRDFVKKDNISANNDYSSQSWKEEFVGWNNKKEKKKQDNGENSGLFNMFD